MLGHHDLSDLTLDNAWESYGLYKYRLKKTWHRIEGNQLEYDWNKFTATSFQWVEKPIIKKMASALAAMERQGCQEVDMTFDKVRALWQDRLGYFSSGIQKQKMVDLEMATAFDVKSNRLVPLDFRTEKARDNNPCQAFPKTGPAVFKETRDLWWEKGINNMLQYLEWYNKQDVAIMMPLIQAMQENFQKVDADVELFRDNVSLPNVAWNVGFKFAEKEGAHFHLLKGNDEGEMVERTMGMHMAGGPSIIFERDHMAHVTTMHSDPSQVT